MDSSQRADTQGMVMKERKSALPVYAFGLVWLVWAWLLPLYSLVHFIGAGVLSLAVFLVLNKLIAPEIEYQPAPVAQKTGDDAADELLREGGEYMSQIRAARAKIKHAETAQKVEALELTLARIFAFVAQNPKSSAQLRKFMSYYLPTLLKLVDSYAVLEAQGVSGENIGNSMRRIEGMLDTMNTAMEKQLDALFGDTALDLSTDITVLEGMLAQEGLSGEQLKLD